MLHHEDCWQKWTNFCLQQFRFKNYICSINVTHLLIPNKTTWAENLGSNKNLLFLAFAKQKRFWFTVTFSSIVLKFLLFSKLKYHTCTATTSMTSSSGMNNILVFFSEQTQAGLYLYAPFLVCGNLTPLYLFGLSLMGFYSVSDRGGWVIRKNLRTRVRVSQPAERKRQQIQKRLAISDKRNKKT